MQGVGERGRDVVVYGSHGRVLEVIQCKNLDARYTAPSLRKELVKLALHNFLDRSILDSDTVKYELFCPGDLTEPAARFIDTWPREWIAERLADDATEVITAYAAFQGLRWNDIGEQVTHSFSTRVHVTYRGGIDLALNVKGCTSIYEDYFIAKHVMSREDVLAAVRDAVVEATGYAQLKDDDAKHLISRVTSFSSEQRVVHSSGYVMGLPLAFVSQLKRAEFELFTKRAMRATVDMVEMVTNVGSRLANEAALAFRQERAPTNKEVAHVFARTLVSSMIDKIQSMIMLVKRFRLMGENYASRSLRERLELHARQSWASYQRCLAGYDPSKHVAGSDEEVRHRIASNVLGGVKNRQEFEDAILLAIDEHLPDLEKRYVAYMSLLPDQLMVITDTMSIFDNQQLMDRMVDTIKMLEKMRGSPILPT